MHSYLRVSFLPQRFYAQARFKLMDSAAPQNAFDANIVNQHAITFNQWNNFVRLYRLYTHIRCIYLFIVIFITAEFQIILKHSEKKETIQNYI